MHLATIIMRQHCSMDKTGALAVGVAAAPITKEETVASAVVAEVVAAPITPEEAAESMEVRAVLE